MIKDFKEKFIKCFRNSMIDENGTSYLSVYKFELRRIERDLYNRWDFLFEHGYLTIDAIEADLLWEGDGIFRIERYRNSRLINELSKEIMIDYCTNKLQLL